MPRKKKKEKRKKERKKERKKDSHVSRLSATNCNQGPSDHFVFVY
jgi:hypothetical protein